MPHGGFTRTAAECAIGAGRSGFSFSARFAALRP